MKDLIHSALELVKPQFRLDIDHGWHGVAHWSRVWYNAKFLSESLSLNPVVPCLFSFLHDSQRFDEGHDILHGHRACEWIDRLVYENKFPHIDSFDLKLLLTAIAGHSQGETKAHPIVQVCWDADRLDLGRVGIRPDPRYLCTEPAKRPEVIEAAWRRSIGDPKYSCND